MSAVILDEQPQVKSAPGTVHQAEDRLNGFKDEYNHLLDDLEVERKALEALRKKPSTPEIEVEIVGHERYITSLRSRTNECYRSMESAQVDYSNAVIVRNQWQASLEKFTAELERLTSRPDVAKYPALIKSLEGVIEREAKGTRYAQSLSSVLSDVRDEIRDVPQLQVKIERAKKMLVEYDGPTHE